MDNGIHEEQTRLRRKEHGERKAPIGNKALGLTLYLPHPIGECFKHVVALETRKMVGHWQSSDCAASSFEINSLRPIGGGRLPLSSNTSEDGSDVWSERGTNVLILDKTVNPFTEKVRARGNNGYIEHGFVPRPGFTDSTTRVYGVLDCQPSNYRPFISIVSLMAHDVRMAEQGRSERPNELDMSDG